MADYVALRHFWNDSDTWRQELWWIVVWLIWGTICAAGIGFGDQSWPEGVLWLLASTLIAAFGQPLWALLFIGMAELTPSRLWSGDRSDKLFDMEAASDSALYWLEKQQLSILDPNRKPWELYPLTVLGVGPIHGLCAGSLVGLGEFYFGDWSKSALQGALVGSLGGIAVVMLIYAIGVAMFIVWTHGPRIESLHPLVRQACAVGNARNDAILLPGHLLLALIETPTGAVAQILDRAEGDIAEARRFILEETEQEMRDFNERSLAEEDCAPETEPLDASTVLSAAIDEARTLHHADVEAGHVLLGLLKTVPEPTTEALQMLGVPTDDLRERIRACWNHRD